MYLNGSEVLADIGLMLVFGFSLACVSAIGFYVVRAGVFRQHVAEAMPPPQADDNRAAAHRDDVRAA